MSMRYHHLAFLSAAAVLAACSDTTGSGAEPQALSARQVEQVAADVADESDEMMYGLMHDDALMPTFAVETTPDVLASDRGAPDRPGFDGVRRPLCATGTFGADADRDGIRDVTLTYTAANCTFTLGANTLTLTGSIAITDIAPTVANRSYELRYTDFTFDFVNGTDATKSFKSVRDGSRSVMQDADSIKQVNAVTLERTYAGKTSTIAHDLTRIFRATGGATLAGFGPLPSGTIDTKGTITWSREGTTKTFTVSTPELLQYDPSCQQRPRIVDGTLLLKLANGGELTLEWTGCGQRPTKTYTPPPSA